MPLPQTEMPGRLQAHFAERGIRMTQQRRAILSVMETASKHLDASQILRKAQKIDASVDRSTVYRTLRLLKRHGLIDELDLMHIHGEGHYYERKLNRDHIHMACLRCGKIMEFVSDIFEKLKAQVEKDCRFGCRLPAGDRRILRAAGDRNRFMPTNARSTTTGAALVFSSIGFGLFATPRARLSRSSSRVFRVPRLSTRVPRIAGRCQAKEKAP